jgi:hypothetical protein
MVMVQMNAFMDPGRAIVANGFSGKKQLRRGYSAACPK